MTLNLEHYDEVFLCKERPAIKTLKNDVSHRDKAGNDKKNKSGHSEQMICSRWLFTNMTIFAHFYTKQIKKIQ